MYYGEKLNSISHVVGAAFSLIGLGALLAVSIQVGDVWLIVGFAIFGMSTVLLYTMSALYHSFRSPGLKETFKTLDRIAIYLLIAGTYAPYTLVSLRSGNGLPILGIVVVLAFIGITSELFLTGHRAKVGQLLVCLAMGWLGSIEYANLQSAISDAGVRWLVAGGLSYTIGVVFYVLDNAKRLDHAHGVWHIFVLIGTFCHFISIIVFVR